MSYVEQQYGIASKKLGDCLDFIQDLQDANARTLALIREHGVGLNSATVENAVRQLITVWMLQKEVGAL